MANSNLIKIKQIDPSLSDFIRQTTSGDIVNAINFSNNTDYKGPSVLYITGGDQDVLGQKKFISPLTVPYSGNNAQTVNKQYISDRINDVTGNFNLTFFYSQGITFNTGDQTIGGNKNFINAPSVISQATGSLQLATYGQVSAAYDQVATSGTALQSQINALAVATGVSGFGGVLSFNGQSGNIFTFGRGGINVIQKGNFTYISGTVPVITGSGVYLIQGDQGQIGLNLNPRGEWGVGTTYSYLDFISKSGNSYVATTGHFSTLSNMPGTGGNLNVAPWQLFVSGGAIGPSGLSGAWQYKGTYNQSTTYFYNNAVSLNGSVYGFGANSIVGLSPTGLQSGWYLLIPSGSIGPSGLQGVTGASGAWQYQGSYFSGKVYNFNNAVSYAGSTYGFSGTATSGTLPSTGANWYLIAGSGTQGLVGPTGVPGPTGAWQYKGPYNPSTTYLFNNATFYGGSTYGFSGSSSIGFTPDTGVGWYMIASSGFGPQGIQGIPGLALAWQGPWLATGNYVSGSAVYYQGSSYGTQQLLSGITPAPTGSPWFLVAQSGTPVVWRDGNGAPSNLNGLDGDYYLDDFAGDVYKRVSGIYGIVSNISSGLTARLTVSGVTNSIADSFTTGISLPIAKTASIISVATDYPAWIRLYGSLAERSADASRPINADPTPGAGVMFDGITTTGNLKIWTSPVATFTSHENVPSGSVPIAITNRSASTRPINVFITYLRLEK